jgi:hypothetical protein
LGGSEIEKRHFFETGIVLLAMGSRTRFVGLFPHKKTQVMQVLKNLYQVGGDLNGITFDQPGGVVE